MAEALFNPYRAELDSKLQSLFKDEYHVMKALIFLCSVTKIPDCKFKDFNENKSKIILRYLDKFRKKCYTIPSKCKFKNKTGCDWIKECLYENNQG